MAEQTKLISVPRRLAVRDRLKVEVQLTARELELIALLVSDAKYFAIADRLRLSFSQTKFLIAQLYLKLGVCGRGTLGVWAAKHDLV